MHTQARDCHNSQMLDAVGHDNPFIFQQVVIVLKIPPCLSSKRRKMSDVHTHLECDQF